MLTGAGVVSVRAEGVAPASPGCGPGALLLNYARGASGGSCTLASDKSGRNSPVELRSRLVPPRGFEPPTSAFVARRPSSRTAGACAPGRTRTCTGSLRRRSVHPADSGAYPWAVLPRHLHRSRERSEACLAELGAGGAEPVAGSAVDRLATSLLVDTGAASPQGFEPWSPP